MTSEESKLFSRIEAFVFDEGSPDMTFADRLAKDNGWDILYALRVIEEYRRFAFLIVTAGHVAVPSDQVDQAWHQHLLYTRSWSSFCRDVVRRPSTMIRRKVESRRRTVLQPSTTNAAKQKGRKNPALTY